MAMEGGIREPKRIRGSAGHDRNPGQLSHRRIGAGAREGPGGKLPGPVPNPSSCFGRAEKEEEGEEEGMQRALARDAGPFSKICRSRG